MRAGLIYLDSPQERASLQYGRLLITKVHVLLGRFRERELRRWSSELYANDFESCRVISKSSYKKKNSNLAHEEAARLEQMKQEQF